MIGGTKLVGMCRGPGCEFTEPKIKVWGPLMWPVGACEVGSLVMLLLNFSSSVAWVGLFEAEWGPPKKSQNCKKIYLDRLAEGLQL